MKRLLQINLLLWSLLLAHQTLWAQEVVLQETFDMNEQVGGRDGVFNNAGTKPDECLFDNEGWDNSSQRFYPAYKCVKFGASKADGILSSPHISLKEGTTATLTFSAAGWKTKEGDNTKNKLTITAEGCQVTGDTDITLTNGEWKDYTVTINDITSAVVITFTGKRGFLDEVVVNGEKGSEIVVTVPEPILTEEFMFWPNTTETTKRIVTITPAEGTSVRYTTDGTNPSIENGAENGTLITAATVLRIKNTTTIKAIGIKSLYSSDVVSKTYTLGETQTNLADFAALPNGTEMRLFLSAEQMAKVTSVDGKQFTLTDNSGGIVVDFGSVPYNPTPVVGHRVAGWIIGKKQTVNGVATMVATDKTTANYMIFAAPVSDPSAIKTVNYKNIDDKVIYYNLAGQRVATPTKGFYIMNGKKIVISLK